MNYLQQFPELKNVFWYDLVKINGTQILIEILLPLPFLATCFTFLYSNLFLPALLSAFFFFLTGLRLSHNAQHNIVGCPKAWCDWILVALSPLMMNSMHAVQVSHLRHHKYCLTDKDEEGFCAKMPFCKALFYGPLFTIRMHKDALHYGTRKQQQFIYFELFLEAALLLYCLFFAPLPLQLFVYAMLTANCLTAFFCVWLVHYECDGIIKVSRTVRSPWLNRLSFNMFLHVEHHLFPQVPTCNLGKLAQRIDEQTDLFSKNKVF